MFQNNEEHDVILTQHPNKTKEDIYIEDLNKPRKHILLRDEDYPLRTFHRHRDFWELTN